MELSRFHRSPVICVEYRYRYVYIYTYEYDNIGPYFKYSPRELGASKDYATMRHISNTFSYFLEIKTKTIQKLIRQSIELGFHGVDNLLLLHIIKWIDLQLIRVMANLAENWQHIRPTKLYAQSCTAPLFDVQ